MDSEVYSKDFIWIFHFLLQVTGLEGLTDLQHLEVLNLSYNAIPTECLSVLGQMLDLTALSLFNMPLAEGDTVLSYIAGEWLLLRYFCSSFNF